MVKKKSRFRILAIETSCDETAAAVVEYQNGKINILSNVVASQVEIHAKTFGVVPEVAARCHAENIIPVIKKALMQNAKCKSQNENVKCKINSQYTKYNIQNPKLNAIAVTIGPGLFGSLLVGVETAKTLAFAWNLPLIPVNHLAGHIAAAGFRNQKSEIGNQRSKTYPALALVVSGGHTELVLVTPKIPKHPNHPKLPNSPTYKIIGETLDDAAGECFDKTARVLGLGYPGGPAIALAAANAETLNPKSEILNKSQILNSKLPRPMLNSNDFNFSFSGLKTAVLYAVREIGVIGEIRGAREIFAAEVQDAIVEVLVKKTLAAAAYYNAKTILVGGGVSANQKLREEMEKAAKKNKIPCHFPEKSLSTDNAAMIGLAAIELYRQNKFTSWQKVKADSGLELK